VELSIYNFLGKVMSASAGAIIGFITFGPVAAAVGAVIGFGAGYALEKLVVTPKERKQSR
jgi:predicted PurR-regulated permease PerM